MALDLSNSQDIDILYCGIYQRSGGGKSTLGVDIAIEKVRAFKCPAIVSNVVMNLPDEWGIKYVPMPKISEVLQSWKDLGDNSPYSNVVFLLDEFDKAFPNVSIGVKKEMLRLLREFVANARKRLVKAIIFTSIGRHEVNHFARTNCSLVLEPTKTLESGFPEFWAWDRLESYERDRRIDSYEHAVLISGNIPLNVLQLIFRTRQIIDIEW